MAQPVIVEAVRTPFGKEDGAFADVRSEDLSIPLVDELPPRFRARRPWRTGSPRAQAGDKNPRQ